MSAHDDLRVAVIAAEQRSSTNHLWYTARDHVADLRVFAPRETADPSPHLQTDLPTRQVVGRQPSGRILVGLQRELAAFDPHVVHINAEPWALTVMRQLLTPRCIIAHGAENQFSTDPGKRLIRYRLTQAVAHRLGGYASWNEAGARSVEAMRPGLPTLVLPAVIPPPAFAPSTWAPPPGERFRVLLLGRLVPEKGFDQVVDAVGSLPTRDAYELVFCGAGPHQAALQERAASRGVRVVFHGQVSVADLAGMMATAGCLVQPSVTTWAWAEQFGRTVAEAMTMGLPALVSSSGELPNLVGSAEYVFAEGEAAEIAAKLERWRTDRGALVAASTAQALRAQRWSAPVAARTVADFWGVAREYRDRQRRRPA